jgi:DNA invertase Pin-like site-specific DNA recombinase
MGRKLIAYYRVSTRKQGESGLGLEGQTAAVEAFARGQGGTILRAYQEVETGKRADRPELLKALADCMRSRATLVIAKLDRLTRNVAFMANLMESHVDFIACDNPHANRITIHILAAVAENEAKMISERTTAALGAYKARGGRLGTDNLTVEGRARGAKRAGERAKADADAAYADLVPKLRELRAGGMSLRGIVDWLTTQGHTTRRGAAWNASQVKRVLERGRG